MNIHFSFNRLVSN